MPKEFRLLVNTLAAITFVALAIAGWALYARFNETNQSRTETQRVWRAVICSIEAVTIKNPHSTREKKLDAVRFYDGLLINQVHTQACNLQIGGTK